MHDVFARIDEMCFAGRSFSRDSTRRRSVFPASSMSSLCIRKSSTDCVSS